MVNKQTIHDLRIDTRAISALLHILASQTLGLADEFGQTRSQTMQVLHSIKQQRDRLTGVANLTDIAQPDLAILLVAIEECVKLLDAYVHKHERACVLESDIRCVADALSMDNSKATSGVPLLGHVLYQYHARDVEPPLADALGKRDLNMQDILQA